MLRFIVLADAVALNLYRAANFTRPLLGLVCVLVMVAWTPVASWIPTSAARRTLPLLALDLALALVLIVLSPVVKGVGFSATVPGFWVIGALMAWAIHYRWRGGLVAGLALAVADLAVRRDVSQANAGNVFLLLIGGLVVGSLAESLHLMGVERDAAERAAAAAAERARLARAVHDGVLQVLALVQRRGPELGAPELGRLAGEQEVALRALIRRQDSPAAPDGGGEVADLSAALVAVAGRPRVEVVTPGPVLAPAALVDELAAAVAACLHNVERHVGPDAPAWVLLEALPDRVVVSVRDEGPGIPAGRLAEAEAVGRLGVSQSVRGRVEDLGGSATVRSGTEGTEWELVVPLRAG